MILHNYNRSQTLRRSTITEEQSAMQDKTIDQNIKLYIICSANKKMTELQRCPTSSN